LITVERRISVRVALNVEHLVRQFIVERAVCVRPTGRGSYRCCSKKDLVVVGRGECGGRRIFVPEEDGRDLQHSSQGGGGRQRRPPARGRTIERLIELGELSRRQEAGAIGPHRAGARAQHSILTKIEAGDFPAANPSGLRGSLTDNNCGQQGDDTQSSNEMWYHY